MAKTVRNFVLGIDIGGTFTDIVVLDSRTEELTATKILTTSPDPSLGVLAGVGDLLEKLEAFTVDRIVHGTTLITNALIERKGCSTGLITSHGFRDALEIGREGRYDIYDLFLERPTPLVERRHRREVHERLDAEGRVLTPLSDPEVKAQCEFLRAEAVESLAVVFLHSYVNPSHEERVVEMVRDLMPNASVSVSHRVAPEFREYERTSTTVANAYVQPLAGRYLSGLETGLRECGLDSPIQIMLSNGGSCSVATAAEFPVRLVESGPCGGALAAAYWAGAAGFERILAFDMGGTTAKAILSSEGQFPLASESEVARLYRFKKGSGLPLLVPVMDMIEIGAGGGSIAHLGEMGLPAVGPQSAGADPGPACYGRGGTEATVTDADLMLGMLDASYFLGGTMKLDTPAAGAALGAFGDALNMRPERAAWGVQELVDENMANAARVHAAERGADLRPFTLVATGGAGPVHACGLAERLGITSVVVPPGAGVGSAFGLLLAPISFDFVRTYVTRLEEMDPAAVEHLMVELEAEGREIVEGAGVSTADISVICAVDMRYAGQGFEIRVPFQETFDATSDRQDAMGARLQGAFDDEYERLYGRLCEDVPVESVHWRVTVTGPKPAPGQVNVRGSGSLTEGDRASGTETLKGTRQAVFAFSEEGAISAEVPVYDRYRLGQGFSVEGPAIIEEAESTTVVRPGWRCRLDDSSGLILGRMP